MKPKSEKVNTPRKYDAPRRAEQAARTRRVILAAARDLFATRGYTATTIAAIAQQAGVAVDTIYATIGRKPALMREVVESAISGTDHPLPAQERGYVQRTIAAPTAGQKFAVYAEGLVAARPGWPPPSWLCATLPRTTPSVPRCGPRSASAARATCCASPRTCAAPAKSAPTSPIKTSPTSSGA